VVALLFVMALGLAILVMVALGYLGGWASARCDDPPRLQGDVPQLLIVGATIVCFVAGGLTNRPMRGVHKAGDAPSRAGLDDPRVRLAMRLTFVGVFLLLTLLMILEAGALFRHVWPITDYVRCANQSNTLLSGLGASIYSFLAGRWLWVRP
jgi:hypothetical protein